MTYARVLLICLPLLAFGSLILANPPKGCKVGDKIHATGTGGFDCMDDQDCNSCFNCSCKADGTLDYEGAGCTYKFCLPKKGCKVGELTHPIGTSGFKCKDADNCNDCFNCTCKEDGTIGYEGGSCTEKACLTNDKPS